MVRLKSNSINFAYCQERLLCLLPKICSLKHGFCFNAFERYSEILIFSFAGNSVFDRAGRHLLLIAGGGASAKKTVQNHMLQMKKICEMAGGVKDLFTNSNRLRQ